MSWGPSAGAPRTSNPRSRFRRRCRPVDWPVAISVAVAVAVVAVVAVVVAAVVGRGDGCFAADAVVGYPSLGRCSRRWVRVSICTSPRCNRQDCSRSTCEQQQRYNSIDNVLFFLKKIGQKIKNKERCIR